MITKRCKLELLPTKSRSFPLGYAQDDKFRRAGSLWRCGGCAENPGIYAAVESHVNIAKGAALG